MSTFLIEGVLETKDLFCNSYGSAKEPRVRDTSQHPIGNFGPHGDYFLAIAHSAAHNSPYLYFESVFGRKCGSTSPVSSELIFEFWKQGNQKNGDRGMVSDPTLLLINWAFREMEFPCRIFG